MGRHRLWTVSDNRKCPVDIVTTLDDSPVCPRCARPNCTTVHGAQVHQAEDQLLTLGELTERLPGAANTATHLDWQNDQVIVLDIEPDCPPEVRNQLLRLVTGNSTQYPGPALYSEVSMSGRGYHILLPVPDAMFSLPGVSSRVKLQHPNKWFEVLMYHWITFSRRPIPRQILDEAAADPAGDQLTWEGLFTQLAHLAPGGRQVGQAMTDLQATQAVETELDEADRQMATEVLTRHRRSWDRELRRDFQGDTSRWEFSILVSVAAQTMSLLEIHALADSAAEAELARTDPTRPLEPAPVQPVDRGRALRIMYAAALQAVPYRDKHEGTRSGLPYLLKQATVALATQTQLEVDQLDSQNPEDDAPVRI